MKKVSSLRDHAVRAIRFGDVSISELRVTRQSAVLRSAVGAESGPLRELVFVLSGELSLRYRGQPMRLRASEWTAFDADQILLSAAEYTTALVMVVPAEGNVRAGIYSTSHGVDSVLVGCVSSALKAAGELTARARTELGNSLIELASLALREKAPAARRVPGRRIMCERVKTFVRHHLGKSTLSIDDIARTFKCTKRYLHKVFSEDGRSLSQFIWDLRLERCGRDLASAELADRSITEIAFGWGFRSPPHFSRAFRQRFGASPSSYRAARRFDGAEEPSIAARLGAPPFEELTPLRRHSRGVQ